MRSEDLGSQFTGCMMWWVRLHRVAHSEFMRQPAGWLACGTLGWQAKLVYPEVVSPIVAGANTACGMLRYNTVVA